MTSRYQVAFQRAAIAWASACLFACGGGGTSNDSAAAAAVTVKETAGGLSVRTTSTDGSLINGGHVQAALYQFSAKVDSGVDKGESLEGTLILKGLLQPDGSTALDGKLVGGKLAILPLAPSRAVIALQQAFAVELGGCKSVFKGDVEALKETLKAQLEGAARPAADRRLNDTQRELLTAFSEAVKVRTEQYQAQVTALVMRYRDKVTEAGGDATTIELQDRLQHGKTVYDVKGTVSADGSLSLKLLATGEMTVVGTGTVSADGKLSGTFNCLTTDDIGTWQATVLNKPVPPESPASGVS